MCKVKRCHYTIHKTWNFKVLLFIVNKHKLILQRKNHTREEGGNISEFPFGIYWGTLKNPKNENFEKNGKKILETSFFTHVYQHPQSYEVQFLRYGMRQIFLSFCTIFCPLPLSPPPPLNNPENQNFEKKKKSIWRCHHFKLVQPQRQSNDVYLLRCGVQQA